MIPTDEKHTAYTTLPEGARIPPLWLQPFVYLLVVGLVMAAMFLLGIGASVLFSVAGQTLPPDIMHSWIVEIALGVAFDVLAVALVVMWISKVEKRPLPSAGLSHTLRVADLGLLVVGGLWAMALISALDMAGPTRTPHVSHGLSVAALTQLPAILVMVVLFAVAEEVVFRGWILSDLAVRVGPPAALVLSSILFGFAHVFPTELTNASRVLSYLSYVAMGLAFGAMALSVGQVWSASALHAGLNAVLVFASLATSTATDARAVWLDLASPKRGLDDQTQAVIWLAVNGVLAALACAWWWWRKHKPRVSLLQATWRRRRGA